MEQVWLKWLAALAWALAGLTLSDAFFPLKRDEVVWRIIAPPYRVSFQATILHWLRAVGRAVRRFTPERVQEWVRRTSAHLPEAWDVDGRLGLVTVSGLAGVLSLFPPTIGRLATGFALGASAGMVWLHFRAAERRARIERDLPGLVDLLLLGLEGGLSLSAALREAAQHVEGPLRVELAEVERQVELGLPRGEALKWMADRLKIRELSTIVTLVNQAENLGTGVSKAVGAIAKRLRTSRVLAAERRAGEAPVKMLFPLVFCLFPSVLVLLAGPVLIGRGRLLTW